MVAVLRVSLQHYGERVGALLEGRQRVGRGMRGERQQQGRPAGTTGLSIGKQLGAPDCRCTGSGRPDPHASPCQPAFIVGLREGNRRTKRAKDSRLIERR